MRFGQEKPAIADRKLGVEQNDIGLRFNLRSLGPELAFFTCPMDDRLL
jgi:hypothetical protein